MLQEIWLPSNERDSKRVGRFVEVPHEYLDDKGVKHYKTVVALLSKIPGKSDDVSFQRCKDNADGNKLKKEWEAAWSHYLKCKEVEAETGPAVPTATQLGVKGTPIEEQDFIGKDQMNFLKGMGFLTLEQLAAMDDSVAQNISKAKTLRKKAKEFLARPKD